MFKMTVDHSVRAAAALVLIAFVASVSATPCERQNCGDHPVFVYFENENCTGATSYSTVDTTFGVCQNDTNYSQLNRIHSTHIERLEYRGNEDCGASSPDVIVTRGSLQFFGACTTTSGVEKRESKPPTRSYMLLANANAAFVSPQVNVVDLTIPTVPKSLEVPCTSEADCKSKGFLFYQYFTNDTCAASDSSWEVNDAIEPYKCYRDRDQYLMMGCYGAHTFEYTVFNDNACTRPVSTTLRGAKCGRGSDYESIYCTAVKPAATSSASSFKPVAIFSVVVAALAIVV